MARAPRRTEPQGAATPPAAAGPQEAPPPAGVSNEAPPQQAPGGAGQQQSMGDDEMAMLERFHDNIVRGIGGGDTPQGQLASNVAAMLTEPSQEGAAGQLATAAAEITALALEGNLRKGVELTPSVVVVGAGLLVDELAQIKERMGDPLSDDEVAQAMMGMWPELWERTANLGFWSQEEMQAAVSEVAQNPAQLDQDFRDVDPQGAGVVDAMPEDRFAPPQGQEQAGGGMPPPPPVGAGGGAPPPPAAPPAGQA